MLDELLNTWMTTGQRSYLPIQESRKPNADGIADLARLNFIEMRDLVADPDFLFKRR